MISTVSAKKGSGLDDLFKDYAPQQLEENKKIIVTGANHLAPLVEKYEQATYVLGKNGRIEECKSYLEKEVKEVITPSEISALFSIIGMNTIDLYDPKTRPPTNAQLALFTNHLIQNSYNAGHNHFSLPIVGYSGWQGIFDRIGNDLRGKRKRPLELVIEGDILYEFSSRAKYLHCTIRGSAISTTCAEKSVGVAIDIAGDFSGSLGICSLLSSFTVHGDIDLSLVNGAKLSAFHFLGGHRMNLISDEWFNTRGCSYTIACQELLDKLLPRIPLGNKIVHAPSGGLPETLWKKHFDERMRYYMRR